ncbi:MAG TPA: hypothetical protein VI756_19715, partial [Blastocatellia bacterium]
MSISNVSRQAAHRRPGRRPTRFARIAGTIGIIVLCVFLATIGLQMGFAQTTGLEPDPSFGKDGHVETRFPEKNNSILAVAIGSDGSIYAAGTTGRAKHTHGLLAKYSSSGVLDTTFGDSGRVVDNNLVTAQAVALQPNGQLLVAGASSGFASGGPALALERYNTNGTLDASFGSGGVVLDTIGPAGDFIDTITVLSNGQILIGGNTVIVLAKTKRREATTGDFALARYNSDGSIDPSFGTNGKVVTDFNGFFDSIKQILIQPNGAILAAGSAGVAAVTLPNPITPGGSVQVLGFARYNTDGSLDTTFGQSGLVTVAVDGVGTEMASAALQSNGQIVASGATDLTLAVCRLNSDGSLDSTFGTVAGFPGQAF